jgi:hypothetical protein
MSRAIPNVRGSRRNWNRAVRQQLQLAAVVVLLKYANEKRRLASARAVEEAMVRTLPLQDRRVRAFESQAEPVLVPRLLRVRKQGGVWEFVKKKSSAAHIP